LLILALASQTTLAFFSVLFLISTLLYNCTSDLSLIRELGDDFWEPMTYSLDVAWRSGTNDPFLVHIAYYNLHQIYGFSGAFPASEARFAIISSTQVSHCSSLSLLYLTFPAFNTSSAVQCIHRKSSFAKSSTGGVGCLVHLGNQPLIAKISGIAVSRWLRTRVVCSFTDKIRTVSW
jgi:hypothetical protein